MPSMHSSLYKTSRRGSYGARFVGGETVVVEGLADLQRALRVSEGNLDKHLRRRLRQAAEPVRQAARSNVTHKWPDRPGDLAGSVKIGTSRKAVSVYSSAPHALVQDQGGGARGTGGGAVGGMRGPHVLRANASKYMTKAVAEKAPEVHRKIAKVLDDLADDFES